MTHENPNCYLCSDIILGKLSDAYCHGCGAYLCKRCDTLVRTGPHTAEEHVLADRGVLRLRPMDEM